MSRRKPRKKCRRRKNIPILPGQQSRSKMTNRRPSHLNLPNFLDICYDRNLQERWPSKIPYNVLLGDNEHSLATAMIGSENINRIENHPNRSILKSVLIKLLKHANYCHRRYLLAKLLDFHIPNNTDFDLIYLLNTDVRELTFRSFIHSLVTTLLPPDLLGITNRYRFAFSCSSNIYHMKRRESVHWNRFYCGFKLSECPWLKSIPNSDYQRDCFVRVLIWLLTLVTAIVRRCFYITESQQHGQRLQFYRKKVWRRIVQLGCIQFRRKCQLTLIKEPLPASIVAHNVRFIPKISSLRAIVTNGEKTKGLLARVKAVLNYIVNRDSSIFGAGLVKGIASFSMKENWIRYAERAKFLPKYIVKIDVTSCFDSILLDRLNGVLNRILNPNDRYVVIFAWIFNNPSGKMPTKSPECAVGWDNDSALKNLRLSRNRKIIGETHFSTIFGSDVRRVVSKTINSNYVRLKGRTFVQKRGIRQGSPLSTLLCNIYLGAMEKEHFSAAFDLEQSLLLRHVDDYLLVTTDRRLAIEFVVRMLNGVDDYGISASSNKTVINFNSNELTPWINSINVVGFNDPVTWCGFAIWSSTLRLSIDMTRADWRVAGDKLFVIETASGSKRRYILKSVIRAIRSKVPALLLDARLQSKNSAKKTRRTVADYATERYLEPLIKMVGLDVNRGRNALFVRSLTDWLHRRDRFSNEFYRLRNLSFW